MKYVNCPTCEWTLGVPGKLLGSPVTCPKCENDFIAQDGDGSTDKPAKKKRKKSTGKLSPRAVPAPPMLTKSLDASDELVGSDSTLASDFDPPAKPELKPEVPSPPTKSKSRLRSPKRKSTREKNGTLEKNKSAKNGNRLVSPATNSGSTSKQPEQQVVARIIEAEPEERELGTDGKLPTLQLKDDTKKKIDTGELKKRPIFLGLVICASVLSSGLMLFLADFSPKTDEAVLNKARDEIRRFYSVRSDIQLKPYQLELREAQLANSRNDRAGEIAAYRKVMTRFRAEDKSQFVGVTGSPGADIELEKLVSILLGDGKGEKIP